jgi:predicted small secreted protein
MIMRSTLIASLVLSVALAAGCNGNDTTRGTQADMQEQSAEATASRELTPEELGELGAEIEKDPDRARELLTERGLDEKSFEQQSRDVTESPEDSRRYAEAYERART